MGRKQSRNNEHTHTEEKKIVCKLMKFGVSERECHYHYWIENWIANSRTKPKYDRGKKVVCVCVRKIYALIMMSIFLCYYRRSEGRNNHGETPLKSFHFFFSFARTKNRGNYVFPPRARKMKKKKLKEEKQTKFFSIYRHTTPTTETRYLLSV